MRTLIIIFIYINLFANSLDNILNKIEYNDDLSNQTKQESGGISYIITRYQLDMMQAKYLKDILKTTVISDGSNRYNFIDPMSLTIAPFGNNNIRVYIDDYEITSMYSENSIYLFSNLRLDFVDHIEIYYLSSADKYFNEPTYVTIKLYSKNPQRDSGLNIFTSFSSKYTAQAFSYAKDNYFISASKNNANDSVNVENKNISKDSKTYNLFAKMNIDNNYFLFHSIVDKRDAFLGMSLDANPDKTYIENKNFYIGYEREFDKFRMNYTLSYQKNKVNYQENPLLIYLNNQKISSIYEISSNLIHLVKLSFKQKNDKNSLNYGIIFKNSKKFDITSEINNQNQYTGIKNRLKYTIFMDDKYQYLKNSMFNIGASYAIYKSSYDNFYTKNVKIGNTYLYNSKNIYKLYYYHTETTPPDYILNSLLSSNPLKTSKADNYIFSYKNNLKNNYLLEIYLLHSKSKDLLIFMGDKGIENSPNTINIDIIDTRFTKYYSYINSLVLEYFKIFFDEVYNLKSQSQFTILNTHRYKKYEFFENIIYKKVKHNDYINDGVDLNLGIKYNINDNFNISLKGENLLSNRYENEYFRYDIKNRSFIEPLKYPTTPKNIVINLECAF